MQSPKRTSSVLYPRFTVIVSSISTRLTYQRVGDRDASHVFPGDGYHVVGHEALLRVLLRSVNDGTDAHDVFHQTRVGTHLVQVQLAKIGEKTYAFKHNSWIGCCFSRACFCYGDAMSVWHDGG